MKKICKHCNKEFICTHQNQLYHRECKLLAKRKRDLEQHKIKYNTDEEYKQRYREHQKKYWQNLSPEKKRERYAKIYEWRKNNPDNPSLKKSREQNREWFQQKIDETRHRNNEYKSLSDEEQQEVLFNAFKEMLHKEENQKNL